MLEDIKKLYPEIDFVPDKRRFGFDVLYGGTMGYVDEIILVYRPITHQQFTGIGFDWDDEYNRFCVFRKYKTIIDVPANELNEEQKAEQRKPIISFLEELKQKGR